MRILQIIDPQERIEDRCELGEVWIALGRHGLWWLSGFDGRGEPTAAHGIDRDAILEVSLVRSFFGLGGVATLHISGYLPPRGLEGSGRPFGTPLPRRDAERASAWIAERLGLPRESPPPRGLPAQELGRATLGGRPMGGETRTDFVPLHGQVVRSLADVEVTHERVLVAGGWLSTASDQAADALAKIRAGRVRPLQVIGLVLARAGRRYGHMGSTPFELVASEITDPMGDAVDEIVRRHTRR